MIAGQFDTIASAPFFTGFNSSREWETPLATERRGNGPTCGGWESEGVTLDVYKITRGTDKVDAHSLSPRVEDSTSRWHQFTVIGVGFKGDLRNNVSTRWVVCIWNGLPGETLQADVIIDFEDIWTYIWIGRVWRDECRKMGLSRYGDLVGMA